jgi:hypothetical protein
MIGLFALGCGAGDLGGGYAELRANDPLGNSIEFVHGQYGSVLQAGEVRLRRSHLDFSIYFPNEFTVGVQGGDVGAILDLGVDAEVAARLGLRDTLGGGQGFAALDIAEGRFNLEDANALLRVEPQGVQHAAVHVGHVYLVRLLPYDRKGEDLIIKLLVVAYEEGSSVGFHWIRLR